MSFISQMSFVCVRKNTNKYTIDHADGKGCFCYNVRFSMSLLIRVMFLFAAVKNKYIMMRLLSSSSNTKMTHRIPTIAILSCLLTKMSCFFKSILSKTNCSNFLCSQTTKSLIQKSTQFTKACFKRSKIST